MRDFSQIFRLMWQERKDLYVTVLVGVIAGILGVALFASSGYLISKAALLPPIYTLTVMLALLKLLGIARANGRYAERLLSHKVTFNILSRIRSNYFDKVAMNTPQLFTKYRSGDLLARVVGDVESLQDFFLRVFYPPVIFILVFLTTMLFTSFYSIYITMLFLAGMVITGVIVPLFFLWKQRKAEEEVQGNRHLLSSEATELLYGFRDLKIYGELENKQVHLKKVSSAYNVEVERKEVKAARAHMVNMIVSMFISVGVLSVVAYQVVNNELDGVFLAMLVMISLNVFEFATPIAAVPAYGENSRRAAVRLGSLEEVRTEETEHVRMDNGLEIKVEDVTFSYDEHRNSLDGVSASFAPGTKTAIVGPSGSGKSTLVQLLMNLYSIEEGTITFNDRPLQHIDRNHLWSHTNIVLQKNHFFYGTIRDNLLLGRETASDEELQQVLTIVGLENKKLDDPVYEKGENLSGGEKQKLAIGRVFLRRANLWLLDEATSSLDIWAENKVLHAILEHARDATVIMVSHKLRGLENMDQIIVMNEGKIIESGSYEDLMDKKGYFYGLKEVEDNLFV